MYLMPNGVFAVPANQNAKLMLVNEAGETALVDNNAPGSVRSYSLLGLRKEPEVAFNTAFSTWIL
jgi:hypothetical protein